MPNTQSKKNNKRLLPVTLILLCALNPLSPLLATPARSGRDNQGLSRIKSCRANQSFEATMFAVTINNTLLNFNPGAPAVINSARFITGLAHGKSVVGSTVTTLYDIDSSLGALVTQGSIGGAPVSPNTGQLFTVGSGDSLQFNSCTGDYQFTRCGAGGVRFDRQRRHPSRGQSPDVAGFEVIRDARYGADCAAQHRLRRDQTCILGANLLNQRQRHDEQHV